MTLQQLCVSYKFTQTSFLRLNYGSRHLISHSMLSMCFCVCSEHGRLDAGVSGVQDIARLALQHRGGSELRGAAGKGPRLHSVHRGLPGSARSVKTRHFTLMKRLRPNCVLALPKPSLTAFFFVCLFSFQWSGSESANPGRAWSNCTDLSAVIPQTTTTTAQLITSGFDGYQTDSKCKLILKEILHQQGYLWTF